MSDEITPPAGGDAPPASEIVARSPRELELESELQATRLAVENERLARQRAERDAMEAQDALDQVKELDLTRKPPKRKRGGYNPLWEGAD